VFSVCYSPDGSRIVSRDITGKTLVWDAAGNLRPDDKPPQPLTSSNLSPDGNLVAVPDGDTIRLWRRRPAPGDYDPFAEDDRRRRVRTPLEHAELLDAAQLPRDAFAAAFHRRCLAQGDNLRLLAWARLAAGDSAACRRTLRQMHEEQHDLAARWQLSAALAGGLALRPLPGNALAAPAIAPVARREQQRRAAVLVRAAALLADSGIPSANLVGLARSGVADEPQSWRAHELLGAALLRDGKADAALRELDEAARLHGQNGSLWVRLFLALAHQRLGHTEAADHWRKKADRADSWDEQVLQLHLLGELERAR
jgi:hypothetical protein